ncbi:MAG: hypothetical protein NC396_07870 [Bacteroides sp.]|nr:hypothetical protein [Bacteroides sp.]MCM1086479.1 hypothetical protein [Bacteroides sp.]
MQENDIRFTIRGSYPNYYILNLFVEKGWREFEKDREPEGNKPGTVIYTLPGESLEREIAPRWYDLYYMLRNEGPKAGEYLRLLVGEQAGEAGAVERLKKIRRAFYDSCRQYVQDHPLAENGFVTSALSPNDYTVDQISHKGVMLADLTRAGYAVPDFSILTSRFFECSLKDADDPQTEVRERMYLRQALHNLEIMTDCTLGGGKSPLILALRSTMPQYIPGLMPTLLNTGTTKEVYRSLSERFPHGMATRIYWNNLMNLYKLLFGKPCPYESGIDEKDIERHRAKIEEVEQAIGNHPQGKDLLEDAFEQIYFYFKHILHFYGNNQSLLATFMQGRVAYPSLLLQKMVWTIGSDYAYPGVLYSRHSRTGLGVQIESYPDIFGEEIMTGNLSSKDYEYFDRAQIRERFPAIYHFDPLLPKLEKRLASPVTVEFGAENTGMANLFAVLQINESELTGRAALLSSIRLYEQGLIPKERVSELVRPYHRRQIFSESIDDSSFEHLQFMGKGVNVLPRSAVSAKICFSTAAALDLKRNADQKVCLCKEKFVPEDTIVLNEMDAILSMTPAAIHVVTACRGYGIPAFLNLEKNGFRLEGNALVNQEGRRIEEFDQITLSSKNASIYKGNATYRPSRFFAYLNGEKLEMNPKEERVFVNMKAAYEKYLAIVQSIKVPDIVDLNTLARLIRNDLTEHPETAREIVNNWFSANASTYVSQLMESNMGSHQDQYRVYELLSLSNKTALFEQACAYCVENRRSGLDAGSFMLGRFLAMPLPLAFWKAFPTGSVAFMLNEYVLYEKYLNVLREVGEQQITKAKARILSDEISAIEAMIHEADTFVPLKLGRPDWEAVEIHCHRLFNIQKETFLLVRMLRQTYGSLFDYAQPWRKSRLQKICDENGLPMPDPEDR